MSTVNAEVEQLLGKKEWHKERHRLRETILGCGLEEAVKWGKLCYAFEGSNVVIIFGLKNYCAVGFFKGSLMNDDDNVLISPGKHSQAMRQMRFRGLNEVIAGENTLISYIEDAIRIEKEGLEVDFDAKGDLPYPDELREAFDDDPDLAEAFENLTPGRQRGYLIHFSDARQSKTRTARIRKFAPEILRGKGLNER